MIKEIHFVSTWKFKWKQSKFPNQKALFHNSGIQISEEGKIKTFIPFGQIKEIIYA